MKLKNTDIQEGFIKKKSHSKSKLEFEELAKKLKSLRDL